MKRLILLTITIFVLFGCKKDAVTGFKTEYVTKNDTLFVTLTSVAKINELNFDRPSFNGEDKYPVKVYSTTKVDDYTAKYKVEVGVNKRLHQAFKTTSGDEYLVFLYPISSIPAVNEK